MKKLYLQVTSGFYKPFCGLVFEGNICIGEIKEKNVSLLKKILYFTVFRTVFSLEYEFNLTHFGERYYLTRNRLFEDDKRYFLKGQFKEDIFVYEMIGFKKFLNIDLTKPFTTAYLFNNSGEKIAYLTTTFGAYKFCLYHANNNKICEFEWKRGSKFLNFWNNCSIDFYSDDYDHILLALFTALVQCIIKQKR
ncbi:MAG: hypothetical protein N2505_06650 [Endomicrobia bacterium]|nr:hypothetical protein [Endomicrobiia bacterium]